MRLIKIVLILSSLLLHMSAFAASASSKILFIRKGAATFSEVFENMKKDLSRKYNIEDYVIDKTTEYNDFKEQISGQNPKLVVLMDNLSVDYAIQYNSEVADASKKLKGVALMGLNLRAILKGNQDFSGIAFEAPAYTLVTQCRFVSQIPINRVLVFYRKSIFQEVIETATKQLGREKIQIQAVNVEQNGLDKDKIEDFLTKNVKKYTSTANKYDAVWVMLDSGILSSSLFQTVWRPAAMESKIPFITGMEELVSKNMNFAAFAVTPNLPDLATQAVQQVESILGDGTKPVDIGVEDLIAVNKILNVSKAKSINWRLKESNLSEVLKVE